MTDRIAVVTGAGSGIGRAVALALGNKGYRVALAGRRADALEVTAQELIAAGGTALVQPTDVTDPASVDALFDATVQHFGRVDLLFNNAGTNVPGVPVDELAVDAWKSVIDVNLTGAFLCRLCCKDWRQSQVGCRSAPIRRLLRNGG